MHIIDNKNVFKNIFCQYHSTIRHVQLNLPNKTKLTPQSSTTNRPTLPS